MTPLLALAVLGVVALGIRAALRGVATAELLAPLALALVATLIAVNKVGSPQFIGWLAVPVVLGLATNAAGRGVPFRAPAVIVLVLAALTQLVYPYFYDALLGLSPVMLVVLSARNVLLFVLLGWAVRDLVALGRRRQRPAGDNGRGYDNDGVLTPVDPAPPWSSPRPRRDGADPSQP